MSHGICRCYCTEGQSVDRSMLLAEQVAHGLYVASVLSFVLD
jgi:hypothetical protein